VKLSQPPVRKWPITFEILLELFDFLKGRHDELMLKCAMSLAFFGCFRAGELCLADNVTFDNSKNLTCGDIEFNRSEKFLTVLLKSSKTDRNNTGVKVHVGCSTHKVCAYCLLVEFSENHPGFEPCLPLFVDVFGTILRNSYFQSTTKLLLSASGHDSTLYSGHSFRAGGATAAADAGFSDWEIKMLGRWASNAYNVYLRNPKIVCSFAERLVN
jgi:integrase